MINFEAEVAGSGDKDKEEARATAAAGWSLYEDRPGKPGWISTAAGSSMTVSLSIKNADWLAFGLRTLQLEVSYLMTYGARAAAWAVFYCGAHVTTIDTRWEDQVSLLKVATVQLGVCTVLAFSGRSLHSKRAIRMHDVV